MELIEAVVAIGSGLFAGSTALVGFGIDSLIESGSGAALLWRLQADGEGDGREKVALKLVGYSFLLLAAWVAWGGGVRPSRKGSRLMKAWWGSFWLRSPSWSCLFWPGPSGG